ncbi:MAG TPA: copper transporter [Candidatus Aquicultor sp.]|jgi:hypothetical protein
MFDMRYHIASLVGVFLALAIGILLGTVIVDKGLLIDQQQALVKKIEQNFDELRTENRTLKDEVSTQRQFADQIIPLTVKDRLAGDNVAVIVTGSAGDEVVSGMLSSIRKAGATASSIKLVPDFKITDQIITQMKPYFSTDLNAENAQDLLIKKMVDELTVNTTTATSITSTTTLKPRAPYLQQLKTIGFITGDLVVVSPMKPITKAVLVGGSDVARDPMKIDLPIILQLKAVKIRVSGVEASDCEKSYVKSYQTAGIPTVDNVDQPMGIISTIFTLAGTDGNFGSKKTAGQLMPSS